MNITPFVGLEGSGQQLIAFQVHNDKCLNLADRYLEELKNQGLVDPKARIVCQQTYTYRQVIFNRNMLHPLGEAANKVFEFIDTGSINHIAQHIDRWKRLMRPWKEAI
jgi:hypothetical protein